MRTFVVGSLALAACPAGSQPTTSRGLVVAPEAGDRLAYCARPLVVTLKVDSVAAPGAHLVAGTGELRGDEGAGRHPEADEILYVVEGWGHATVGADTIPLGPGSIVHVPPGVAHRLVSTGRRPMTYFFVLGPDGSSQGLRQASTIGCAEGPASATASTAPKPPMASAAGAGRAVWIDPSAGDRIAYCLFPLTITTKIDSASAPGTRLTAAAGALRRGAEVGTHPIGDEVALFTRGSGRAFIGTDTVAVRAGSVTFVPQGAVHGFINDGEGTLEYVVVYQRGFSSAGFRRLAARPGPHCPAPDAGGRGDSTEQELAWLQRDWAQAAVRGDADAFARFMDERFVVVSRGASRTRAEWVESVRTRKAAYDSVAYRDVQVRVYGDTAVVSGEYVQRATLRGASANTTGVFVSTWVRRGGRWLAVGSIYP